jgi:hypothetical protein
MSLRSKKMEIREFCVPGYWSTIDTARIKLNARYFAFTKDQRMAYVSEDFDIWRLISEKVEKLPSGEIASVHLVFTRIARENLKPDSPINLL